LAATLNDVLLDTSVALPAIADNPNLPAKALELITTPRQPRTVSVSRIWETQRHADFRCRNHSGPFANPISIHGSLKTA
jgi:hypothetical protein